MRRTCGWVRRSPLGDGYFEEATRRGLRATRSTTLLSVVFNGDASQLTNVAAVAPTATRCAAGCCSAAEPFGARHAGCRDPGARGGVAGLASFLAAVGGTVGIALSIGAATLRVSARAHLASPTRAALSPSSRRAALMNAADLPATHLIQPGSRVSYAGLFAGERATSRWLQGLAARTQASRGERLRDISGRKPPGAQRGASAPGAS